MTALRLRLSSFARMLALLLAFVLASLGPTRAEQVGGAGPRRFAAAKSLPTVTLEAPERGPSVSCLVPAHDVRPDWLDAVAESARVPARSYCAPSGVTLAVRVWARPSLVGTIELRI